MSYAHEPGLTLFSGCEAPPLEAGGSARLRPRKNNSEFLSIIGYELRTLLAAVCSALKLLQDGGDKGSGDTAKPIDLALNNTD